ncbi:3'-5' exonuclease [Wenyingzhuangia sp. 2_MG-2023]|uniref:3'-5' exonuclease n=1 Tax=Wenyingzhuangia sp. 2_MG-2023 TaxID=3062639 RepID=UPI0026E35214|nr:3'-5' exonuclease [Wenyingzhuangia sp. 2_MG-2023]MDO6736555.1 3'-5' exonuclease [Wenyingzhuangia sp. 2_MG-2023]MDO6801150.1 3'-5' exonuclease [Wenyingzhuangia sp. 1_MG-2023]
MNFKVTKENILFLDIETVPLYASYQEVPEIEKELFAGKTAYKRGEDVTAEEFYTNAGIWAEFGKIVCISVGYFASGKLRITSFASEDEKEVLLSLKKLLETHFNQAQQLMCGHNAKEFDFPFIARRMVIHGINLPSKLNLFGKKPWEIPHLDTLELWKFGDYKHYTSLKLLTYLLEVPSPKGDIDGSQVGTVYHQEKDLPRIVRYCEQDVLALSRVYLKFNNEPTVEDEDVVFV